MKTAMDSCCEFVAMKLFDLFSPGSVLDLFDWRSLLRDILDQHQPISYILDLAC